MNTLVRSSLAACAAVACAIRAEPGTPPNQKGQAEPVMREVFPGVRVDLNAKVVEFDGTVPVNAHTKADLKVFLETTVCGFDSKEHESLVVTKAKPSQVHAALLLLGLKPGKPGAWKQTDGQWVGVPPDGDAVEVRFVLVDADGIEREQDPAEWIVNVKDGKTLKQIAPDSGWVFAGSRLARKKPMPRAPGSGIDAEAESPESKEAKPGPEFYVADSEGTLIGLTSFGTETIGWSAMYNPDNDKEAPEWIASREKTPEIGTKVTVRIRPKKIGS
ncbi:MAG: hypothetical protein KF805_01575 [Phycisphaeraceae bacterium]|nr:hypothetical protein [Phycisphaeraceae bacterium]